MDPFYLVSQWHFLSQWASSCARPLWYPALWLTVFPWWVRVCGCGSSANWPLRLGNATTKTAAVSIRGKGRVSCYRVWVSGESMPAWTVCSLGLVCAHGARWALLWVCECGLFRLIHLGLHMAQQTVALLTSMPADMALAQMPPKKVTCPNCSHGTNRRLVPSHAESSLWCGVFFWSWLLDQFG